VKQGGGRPQAYKTADGKRCPGVTTIVNRFKDSGGLIHWAWQQGIDGKDFRETRDKAADAGGIAHEMIDAEVHGLPLPEFLRAEPEHVKLALKALEAFREWRAQVKLRVLETEVPLISEKYRFGGTFDADAKAYIEQTQRYHKPEFASSYRIAQAAVVTAGEWLPFVGRDEPPTPYEEEGVPCF
jgi:hypothetical protein